MVDKEFSALLAHVRRERGLDYGQYKESFLRRRLAVRMRARGVESYREYLAVLQSGPAELDALLDALTINVSYFFRDRAAIGALRDSVLAPLLARRAETGQRHLTAWSAGCAAGEEPYSVVMLLADLLGGSFADWKLEIDATDIDAAALARARRGVYQRVSFSPGGGSIPQHLLQAHYVARFFIYDEDRFTIRPEIRSLVTFRRHDLTQTPPRPRYDLILCRNVLIYFARQHQERIISHLLHHLEPGGYLMLGMAEMLPLSLVGRVESVDGRRRIYRKPSMES